MKKNLLIQNAATSMLQIVVSGLTLILLYKVLIRLIGIDQLGVWSLVMATTSMAQLASMGITGSIVKFVAKYGAARDESKVSLLIQTAAVTMAVIFIVLLLVAYPCAVRYLSYALQGALLAAALSILPHALVAYWTAMITSVFQAGLYGSQQIAHRNFLLMADSICYLVLCYFVAGKYGLVGLAWARVLQNLLSLAASWVILRASLPALPWVPWRWDRAIFKEILCYSMNFQLISILSLVCDPLTKGLLSRFGSASLVGYYEMANRLVQQFRALIVSANQVLVPAFAQLKELDPERIRSVYLRSYRLLFFITVPVFSALVVGAPLVSELWIGRYEASFVASTIILSAGWFVNTLCVPAYYAGMGTGELRWNVISHAGTAVLNIGLGFILGARFGGLGVVAGWALANAAGGIILVFSFHSGNGIPQKEYFPQASRRLCGCCIAGVALSYLLYATPLADWSPLALSGAMVACFAALLSVPVWIHPLRKELMDWGCSFAKRSAAVRATPLEEVNQ